MKRPAKQLSKSHFMTKVKSDILLNNLCECFNKIVLQDREKSIVTLLIDIHIGFVKRIRQRREKTRRVARELCQKIEIKLLKNVDMAGGNEVDWNRDPSGTSKLKKKGSVVMMCICRLTGHNKRYHERDDAPHETKLQLRRSNRKCTTAPGLQPPPSEFQFIPTPGVGLSNTDMYNKASPTIDDPNRSRFSKRKNIGFS
ncbi:SWIM-type domain-containing protein [Abeliophyllum distichum]|uniref:SWIM-type domain-containing protein n=1 Tax=Abeliophyllum distichum TaxID=126358 RepID=A0ABD1QWQ7_9LAMI